MRVGLTWRAAPSAPELPCADDIELLCLARQIEGRYQRVVTLVDERLSSREAKAAALASGHDGDFEAKPIDDEAAAIILTTWLNEK